MKTRREELALAVLRDAINAALESDEPLHRLRRRFHERLIKVLRYYGKPRGRHPRPVSSRDPGVRAEAVSSAKGPEGA